MYAAEDKKKKEKMDALNQAETTVYQTEKTLKELGDKVTEQEKKSVEEEIEKLKKVKDDKDADSEKIRAAIDAVMNKFQPISTRIYQEAAKAQEANKQDTPNESGAEKKDDNVVDAEYEEVDKDKKD